MSKVADVFESLEYGPALESAQFATEWLEQVTWLNLEKIHYIKSTHEP